MQKLLRKARKGVRVIYVPGNHDEFARDYIGSVFGGIEVAGHAYHTTADGQAPADHPWRPVRRRRTARALARLSRRLGL